MIKRTFNTILSLSLIGVLILFVIVFMNRSPTSVQPVPQSSSADSTTTENGQASPEETTSAIITATMIDAVTNTTAMIPTPLPNQGIYLTEWQPLVLQGGDADYLKLRTLAATDNIVAAVSMTNTQGLGSTIITIDLTNGLVQRITKFGPPRILYMHASENRIVWSEQLPSSQSEQIIMEALHVYDLRSRTESIVVPEGYFQMMHYKHGLAVWGGELNKVQGIHAYNFDTKTLFTIEASDYGHIVLRPRACSNEWVIYILTTEYESPYVQLQAHNVVTKEVLDLGIIALPRTMNYTDTKYDCDGENIVWLEADKTNPAGALQEAKQIRLYNLKTQKAQPIDLSDSIFALKLNGNLISTGSKVGLSYDLEQHAAFAVSPDRIRSASAEQDLYTEKSVTLDRWIQLQEDADGRPTIYTASLVRNH